MLFVIKAPFMSADLSLVTVLGLSVFWKNVGLLVQLAVAWLVLQRAVRRDPGPVSSRVDMVLHWTAGSYCSAMQVVFCRPIFREIGFPWVPVQSHR